MRSRPALGARPAREAVAVTSAPQLLLRTAGPAPVPAGSSPGGSVLTVPEPAKGRLCHTPVPRADGAQAAPQGFSARGPEPGSADRSFRKEREATGSARNGAARRVATGSGAPRPDGRAQRCVRRELTVPSFGLLPEPPRVTGERRRVMPRNPLRMRGDPGHPSAWPQWLEPHLDTAWG